MIHLRELEYRPPPLSPNTFPFTVPFLRAFTQLAFESEITFFVGENGSGKSTLLEVIAAAARSITVGSADIDDDPTLAAMRDLARHFKLTWTNRTRRGFFLRAEDFFGYAKRMAQIQADLEADIREVENDAAFASAYAKGFGTMPMRHELADLRAKYGSGGLDANSHGEGFMKLFRARFTGPGLYLLDEPEAALSPTRQLALLALLHEMVGLGGQFIIATHAPILMAYPGAAILHFDGDSITPIKYESVESVALLRAFLNHPDTFLNKLFGETDDV